MTNLAARVKRVPHGCVWEITTACNLRCIHCEVAAGAPRAGELSTAELLDLADQLDDLGARRVSLTGGEPLLRKDWPQLAERLSERGLAVKIVTNGTLLDAAAVERMIAAGVSGVAVSLDGLRELHDHIRRPKRPGPSRYDAAVRAIELLVASPMRAGVITQINRQNLPILGELHELLTRLGVDTWQLQLAYPLGRALTHCGEEFIIRPAQLPELEQQIAGFINHGRPAVVTADNIGYYGKNEPVLRFGPKDVRTFWMGCMAGCLGLCLHSDGDVKGCPTHPPQFIVGNVRDEPLADIWADRRRFAYNTLWDEALLEGQCARCSYRRVCRAGCTTMAFAVTGTIYDNPFCIQQACS